MLGQHQNSGAACPFWKGDSQLNQFGSDIPMDQETKAKLEAGKERPSLVKSCWQKGRETMRWKGKVDSVLLVWATG